MKRVVDIVASSIGLVLVLPILAIACCAIKSSSPGPAIFKQQRIGRHFRPFTIYKLRTMVFDASHAGCPLTRQGDKRITRVGAVLRYWKIDELPQLVNVVKGDMSLVGPRPERPELVERILRDVPDFDLRSLVRPGIAGLAQVSAEYETRPEVKLRYDLMYMCDWSIWLDFRLLLHAVSSSLAGTGR